MKLISIVIPCYNEEDNIIELYSKIKDIFKKLSHYQYECIFIDNDSKDKTVNILRQMAFKDSNVKIIINARNFGHIRSPYYGLLQTNGDASILIAADLQDPPQMIYDFILAWESGYKIVIGIKEKSEESRIMFAIRSLYYKFVTAIAEVDLVRNFTGFGLYDRDFLNILKKIDDPYPYFRGFISDIGFERKEISYTQPTRKHGKTKNNFYTLYDTAMLGITNYSKLPIRLATIGGFFLSILSFCLAIFFLLAKLLFWRSFSMGIAPILCGLFFFFSVQLFFIGLLGEYIGSIHTKIMKRPLVVEKERVNFDIGQKNKNVLDEKAIT
ncbi:glycosyltransferase family 2 protein [Rickettsiella endosymbiont of Miltochrista miniata]|uniref:glycosyltransferase family 2 protein n=1 Tax=Rickettsiella endosymbiont of Miltochrista miniata TaxID=3066239 RepID=UPI00313EE1F1